MKIDSKQVVKAFSPILLFPESLEIGGIVVACYKIFGLYNFSCVQRRGLLNR